MQENLTLQHEKVIDLGKGEIHGESCIKVNANVLNNGLIAKIGINEFATLMALISYVDKNGECCPTQLQLAKRIGVHKNTVNKYVKNLLSVKINDKPIVTRMITMKGCGKCITSWYKFHL
ncbi:helix-turn-helix domain-containing protein [Solibacillus sp. MA9]|uniref:Helix-turn-helix domain-containing protein n=1 Tax=Solibacillus palustris TaxID=2908203 RepID=A0ABS9U809_9BACL|nr:helix-turn-helix domain-containing protein [Solibacillus sp. MA9]MCH7320280.1 helix-turn-helix domain-containing protein [Solibacillus sp. MA9]